MSNLFISEPLDNMLNQVNMPGKKPGINERNIGKIISLFTLVYLVIEKCRKEISLIKLYEYDPKAPFGLNGYIITLSKEHQIALDKYSNVLADELFLSEAWILPFKIAILTNYLPIPEDPMLVLYGPLRRDTPRIYKKLFRWGLEERDSVVIEILRKPNSLHDLYEELKKNEDKLMQMFNMLKLRPSTKMSSATMVWGRAAAITKAHYPNNPNWPNLLKQLEKVEPQLKKEVKDLPPLPDTPEELIKLMQNFNSSINRNYPHF